MTENSTLHFWKMHGIGNDFVVLDAIRHPLPDNFDYARAAKVLCERGFGIGSDGLLLIDKPTPPAAANGATLRKRMWNPDGSEDMCGNGLRCVVHLAHAHGHVSKYFKCETWAGLRQCEILENGQIRVEMGKPLWSLEEIPLREESVLGGEAPLQYFLEVDGQKVGPLCSLSTGSTHTVFFTDDATTQQHFEKWSAQLEEHEAFPMRTSIMWTQIVDDAHLKVRIWERGIGETLACGTGACAAAVAAIQIGRAKNGIVSVQSAGGTLKIEWQPGRPIYMTGPAQIVFEGQFNGNF